jgi:hypothetical protein
VILSLDLLSKRPVLLKDPERTPDCIPFWAMARCSTMAKKLYFVRCRWLAARALALGLAVGLGLGTGLAIAACPAPNLSDPETLRIKAKEVLVVTHASNVFEPRYATKHGIDSIVRFAKERKIPVIYLVDDSPIQTYFFDDCAPDHWVNSIDGDITFPVEVDHIYLAGGHVELCLSRSIHDLLLQASRRPGKSLSVTYVMDAVYSNGKTIQPSDPFYSDFVSFMGVVTYGRPGGERWPKLTLLEATGIIKRPEWDYMYLEELLPRWDRTFPENYRVELQMDDLIVKVLRPGAGFSSPTIKFHFIDSADLIR